MDRLAVLRFLAAAENALRGHGYALEARALSALVAGISSGPAALKAVSDAAVLALAPFREEFTRECREAPLGCPVCRRLADDCACERGAPQ